VQLSGSVPDLSCRKLVNPIPDPWRITSFSSLSKTHSENDIINDDAGSGENARKVDKLDDDYSKIGMFPRGETAGLFLHELLENTDLNSLATIDYHKTIRELLTKYNFDSQWEVAVAELLVRISAIALPPSGIQLKNIALAKCIKELQFHFPVTDLTPQRLHHVLAQEQLDLFSPVPYTAENIDFKRVSGYMKGFIDLLMYVDGKFYIFDWKSNYLGTTPDDYTIDAMEREMNVKHYKLQYYIYTTAVIRYLSMRYKGFDYNRNFGGIYYLFLRGLQDGQTTGIYFDRPNSELVSRFDGLFGK
jgi:exodeoxyribonuclease V beta subunit